VAIEYRITIKVKSSKLDDVCETLLKFLNTKELFIHPSEIVEQKIENTPEVSAWPKPVPKPPTPIVTRDKRAITQEDVVLQFLKDNPNRVILNSEFATFARNKQYQINSVMTAVSKLTRTHPVTHMGRGQGYLYNAPNH
jgi:hypothetical protein